MTRFNRPTKGLSSSASLSRALSEAPTPQVSVCATGNKMIAAERWLPVSIKELRTTYEVSDLGRVRRCAPHPKQHHGLILTPYTSPWGTLIVRLRQGSRDHHLSVAMLVAK